MWLIPFTSAIVAFLVRPLGLRRHPRLAVALAIAAIGLIAVIAAVGETSRPT
ncbi:MAG: hypothetical protein U0869_09170 [Chloroflexota bacterium]